MVDATVANQCIQRSQNKWAGSLRSATSTLGPLMPAVRHVHSSCCPINSYDCEMRRKTTPFSERLFQFHQTVPVGNLGLKDISRGVRRGRSARQRNDFRDTTPWMAPANCPRRITELPQGWFPAPGRNRWQPFPRWHLDTRPQDARLTLTDEPRQDDRGSDGGAPWTG